MRAGVDVGGTFTDSIVVDDNGHLTVAKTLTTPADVSIGTMASLKELTTEGDHLESIVHGTTLVTNTLIERRGAPVGLLTTAGFRDTLAIRRTRRETLYDLNWKKPPSLVPRRLRREVRGRIDRNGETITPLDENDVRDACELFVQEGIEDIAICFLFSFRNDAHEQRAAAIVRELLPTARLSLSSEVVPEIREYERASTTVLNAMSAAVLETYLQALAAQLEAENLAGDLRIIKADGGVASPQYISRRSVEAYNSGPAAGVAAAVELGRMLNVKNLLTLDMGGTSTDVSVIWNGEPLSTMEGELEFGIPIRSPMVYIRSIGAGGGSVAYIDRAGALQVGPESAGADPGPACYGRGGDRATVTDANVVLGRIDPNYFAGGGMALDVEAAHAAVGKIAEEFRWTVEQAAEAISRIALANLVGAVREVSIDRGYDPRDFFLIAYGGAGGLYAAAVASELGIPEVVLPRFAGVFSAVGCLCADFKHERLRTLLVPATEASGPVVTAEWESLVKEGWEFLSWRGDATVRRFLDMRYVGEAFELLIEPDRDPQAADLMPRAVELFHAEHERLYGFRRLDPVEVVNTRVQLLVPVERPPWGARSMDSEQASPAAGDGDGDLAFYHRDALEPGRTVKGPAVVRDEDATTVLPQGHVLTLDEFGHIHITPDEVGSGS